MTDLNAGYLSAAELDALGVANAEERNILIHRTAVILNISQLQIDRDVRVDPFCVITCHYLSIGRFVHIGANCSLSGKGNIHLGHFSSLSHGCRIFSSDEDYSGRTLTNPTVPSQYKDVRVGCVRIEDHVILGTGTVVLPEVTIEEGVSVGALSLVRESLPSWTVQAGVPARKIGERNRGCLQLAQQLMS